MRGRACLLSFVAGSCAVHFLAQLPAGVPRLFLLLAGVLLAGVAWKARHRHPRTAVLSCLLAAALLGFWQTAERAAFRLAQHLAASDEGQVSRVVVRVTELVQLAPDQRRFRAYVVSSRPKGVPGQIQVTWSAPGWSGPYRSAAKAPATFPDIKPGQLWRMALTLKTPSGLRNPDAFDYEAFQFAKGIRAMGTVRGTPRLLSDDPWVSLPVLAERVRDYVRSRMLPYVHDMRYGGVLLALAIGDQDSIADGDWRVFNKVALTHAISISGSHITMIAALGGWLTLFAWRRARWGGLMLAERCPAQVAAAMVALVVAWLYCLLAGWGVPAQRTFVMLAVVALAYGLRLPVSPSRVLALAAFVVVLLDPWSVFSTGFWLSFGAVYVLMACSGAAGQRTVLPAPGRWARWRRTLWTATRLQWVITLALGPPLAYIFHEISLVSPLANAYAIPLLGFVVTPAALVLAAVSVLPGPGWVCGVVAWLGHAVMQLMMWPTQWLANWSLATIAVPVSPVWVVVLAGVGVVLATQLHGLALRHVCWALALPLMLWRASAPAPGGWRMMALDIGQGSAIVIQTHRQAFLFDTGLRSGLDSDMGQRVIVPFLKSRGITRLDALVLSHADIDHAGGALSVLQAIPVGRVYASFDVPAYLSRQGRLLAQDLPVPTVNFQPCRYGLGWQADGVGFGFVWPADTATSRKTSGERNARACVLRVQGLHHSALLPSDIGHAQERALVSRGVPASSVVLVAHHGSRHSSHPLWVAALQARHVIAQAGYANRYGHPDPTVEQRWQQAGARFWRTDRQGAIQVDSTAETLTLQAQRHVNRRYWQSR
jgi:competence protein ComEC